METNGNSTAHHQVELMLPGIDKVWVRSKGQWVDKESLKQAAEPIKQTEEIEAVPHVKKAWWKFWRK